MSAKQARYICPKCGKSKPRFVIHKCSEREQRRYQAVVRARDFLRRRFNADQRYQWQGNPGVNQAPSWDLPAPAPATPRLDSTPKVLPLPGPTVTLLPTVLLRETTAQRGQEPLTVKTRKYKSWETISSFRKLCRCPAGQCTPAALSTLYHSLPWSYTVALDAPPGELLSWVNYFMNTGLQALDLLCSNPVKVSDPFYVLTVASHEPLKTFDPERPVGLHAHLAVGNLDWSELQGFLRSWPGFISPNAIRRTDPVWKALHYVLSQDPRTGDDLIDSYPSLRHLVDYGYGAGLLYPPIFSESLDGVRAAFLKTLRRNLSPSRQPEARAKARRRARRKKKVLADARAAVARARRRGRS